MITIPFYNRRNTYVDSVLQAHLAYLILTYSLNEYTYYSGNCITNYNKGKETSFVSHIVYASMLSILYFLFFLKVRSCFITKTFFG